KSCPTTLQANTTYSGCDWPNGATVAGENVTIRNSRIRGKLSNPRQSTLVEDTTFIGPGTNDFYAVGGGQGNKDGGTYRRIRCTQYSTCFYTQGPITVEDSVIYDILNTRNGCHVENVLLNGSGQTIFRRTWLYANWYNGKKCSGGGLSAVIAMYSHSRDGWSAVHNK